MTTAEAVRLTALCAQVEMALVRRDAVAGPLLAQAARAAAGTEAAAVLEGALELVRTGAPADRTAPGSARRKAAQALVRAAAQRAQAALLEA